MIPKVIHKIWLSGEEMDTYSKICVESWKKVMPDYQIKEWSLKDFDIDSMPYVKKAISMKKWAFANDYLRMYVVNKEGGIYLDTDVYIKKSLDEFLKNDFFSFVEFHPKAFKEYKDRVDQDGNLIKGDYVPGLCIQAAAFGAIPNHPFTKKCLEYYDSLDSKESLLPKGMIAPDIYAKNAIDSGFKYIDENQDLINNMKIYKSDHLAGSVKEYNKDCYGVHMCLGSWRDKNIIRDIYKRIRLKKFLLNINK